MSKFYVYITTNLINKKQYIGDHFNKKKSDKYLGSGTIILHAIKKYGKQNFKKEILEQFETKQEAFNAQENYINLYHTLAPNGYNISPKGGYGVPQSYLNIETKRKIGFAGKGRHKSEETKIKMSLAAKGKKKSPEHIEKIANSKRGKKQSEKTKEKRRIAMLGKNTGFKSEQTKLKISNSRKGKPAWNKGIPCSINSKQKQIQTKIKKGYINKSNIL